MLVEVLETIRGFQAHRAPSSRLLWNRVLLHVWPTIELGPEEIRTLVTRLAPMTAGLGIEMLLIRGRLREPDGERARAACCASSRPTGRDVVVEIDDPPTRPLQPLDEGTRRMISARRRGTLHPAEIVRLLAPGADRRGPAGGDVRRARADEDGRLVPVERPPATNPTGIVVGTIRNFTERYPEGMLRVILLGDPTRALGSLAEPECRRIIAALDLAEELGVPLEWFALSAGAKIAMDSGTETMDWIAAVLRRIVLFTQAGGELNVVVAGINVGAQPYWNAEATMLMHTRGVLIMTPESAMVLTGKQALDYSGGVSAEDNFGIGGYERIMGPNGQAQYWARDLAGACRVLLAYYEHTYVAPGERFPRRARTSDPAERDIGDAEHRAPGSKLLRVARRLLRHDQRGAQAAVRHPLGDACGDRPRPPAAGALGGNARGGDRRGVGRTPRRLAGLAHRDRVAAAAPARPDPGRRTRAVDRRARSSPARRRRSRARSTRRPAAGRSSCWPTSPASTARPSRCASGSSSSAPRSAERSSTSTDQSCSASCRATTAGRSSCSHRG